MANQGDKACFICYKCKFKNCGTIFWFNNDGPYCYKCYAELLAEAVTRNKIDLVNK